MSEIRRDIQGLRAAAVLPVVLFHFGATAVSGGFAGVDVFFVISGFVISMGLVTQISNGKFSLYDFYARRTRRILPPLLVTCALTTVAACLLLLPADLVDFSKSLLATILSVSNFYFWKHSGYFAPESQTQPLLHCWSLGVEEQFYMLMPLAMMAAWRLLKGRWLAFIIPLWLVSFAISLISAFVAPTSGFFLLPARAWELATGAGLAVLASRGPNLRITPVQREVVALLGVGLILAAYLILDETVAYPAWNALLPCGGTALVIWAGSGAQQAPTVNRLLGWGPLNFIGTISYSLYLVHWPLAALFYYRFMIQPTATQGMLLFILSIVLAVAMHYLVEKQVRYRTGTRARSLVKAGISSVAVLFAFSGAVWASSGFPGRYPGYEPERRNPAMWGGPRCFNEDRTHPINWDPALCTRAHGKGAKVLLWGDSYAAHYGAGLADPASPINAEILQYTSAGCPPILADKSLARLSCSLSNARVLQLIKDQHVNAVVLTARWTKVPPQTLARLHETVEAVSKLGVAVVVIGQIPEFAAPTRRIDWVSGQTGKPSGRWAVSFDRRINQELAEQAKGAIFVDPMAAMCPEGPCVYRTGKDWLYQDFGHFSDLGSREAVRSYFPRFPAQAKVAVHDDRHSVM